LKGLSPPKSTQIQETFGAAKAVQRMRPNVRTPLSGGGN